MNQYINIEIKAKSSNDKIRKILKQDDAEYIGTDHQIDIYFNINNGRLKLRKGNIENFLIYYNREDKKESKQSDVILFKNNPESALENILTKSLGVLVKVDKTREIYWMNNVKFHLDYVKNLGEFMEIEAIDQNNTIGREKLLKQCNFYLNLFQIKKENLINCSYSDLLLGKK